MGEPSPEDSSAASMAQPLASIAPVVNDHETDKARQARLMYALMDPGARSAKAVADAVGCAVLTVEKWSSKYKWKEFAKRSDNAAYQRALTRVEAEREEAHFEIIRSAQHQAGRSLGPVIDKARDIIDLPSIKAIQKKDKGGKVIETIIIPVNVGEHESAARVLKTVVQMTTALLGEPDGHHKIQLVKLPDWLTAAQLDDLESGDPGRAGKVIKMIEVRGQYEPDDSGE